MSDLKVKQFGWKRKIGGSISKVASTAFEQDAKDDDNECLKNGDVDWLTLAPVKKKFAIGLEDAVSKAHRLVQEGTVLASSERYWEALKKFEEALQFTPANEKIYEMKAQAFMELCEVYPAVQAARKAVSLDPTWWIAHQTLGRAFLGMGEVRMAVRSFSKAVHINPEDQELWQDDLLWAQSLLQQRQHMKENKLEKEELTKSGVKITEIHAEGTQNCDDCGEISVDIYKHELGKTEVDSQKVFGKLPHNYVQMRDMPP